MIESVLRGPDGVLRPFCQSAQVTPRGYSVPLQRAMSDFGADESFAQAAEKLMEHYGIAVPVSAIRSVTQHHGQALSRREADAARTGAESAKPAERLIAEVDGTMVPIVQIAALQEGAPVDGRKRRAVQWQEARLSLVRPQGSASPVFAATLGTIEKVGNQLYECARRAGYDAQTHVHGVGDGAVWIANQFEEVFGAQASYLVDIYHVCEYLASAAKSCARPPIDSAEWMEQQKQKLKESRLKEVLATLHPHLEPEGSSEQPEPVRACYRYLNNRREQLDYAAALEAGLPIGSGEVESAHRHVIQKRLKISGAWWKADNAEKMLDLRVARANGHWNQYWQEPERLAA